MIARQWTVATRGEAAAAGSPIVTSEHKSQHRRRVIHWSKKLEVGRQRATEVGRQRTTEVGRQRTTEVGRQRTTEIDRTKRLITKKKDSKLQGERLNRQEAYKATGIGSKK